MTTRLMLGLALLALTGCETVDHEIKPTMQDPGLDLALTEGFDEDDHVEVAPGVFLLRELVDAGTVRYHDLGAADFTPLSEAADLADADPSEVDADETDEPDETDAVDETGDLDDASLEDALDGDATIDDADDVDDTQVIVDCTDPDGFTDVDQDGALDCDDPDDGDDDDDDDASCWEYESDVHNETTANGTLFGGNPTWYGSATASSAWSQQLGWVYDYDYVTTYLYAWAPTEVDWAQVYGYVYINGTYAGYVWNYAASGSFTSAYGYWTSGCGDDGALSIEVYTYHYLYDGPQFLSVGDLLSAKVECCP